MARLDPPAVYIWAGRLLPVFLTGIVGYATYVVVVRLCINYLLRVAEPRVGAAVAILTLHSVLLSLVATTYFRTVYIVNLDPGYVPLGPGAKRQRGQKKKQNRGTKNEATADSLNNQSVPFDTFPARDMSPDSPGLEGFYTKDIFVSEADGRPRYCSECATWKPDRSHHCSDVGRCVRKMDHFCPWVGGVVGENSFKFFVQFNFYACVYCIFLFITMVYYLAEQTRLPDQSWDSHFAAIIGFSAFFGLFTSGTAANSIYCSLANLTTIENLNRRNKVWQLAVLLPNQHSYQSPPGIMGATGVVSGLEYSTITYPLPRTTEKSGLDSAQTTESVANSTNNVHSARDMKAIRTFALLRMSPGQNPWDLGVLGNWKSVMGSNIFDWLLPVRRSPCCNHESGESQFPVGRGVEQLKASYGLTSERDARKAPLAPDRSSAGGRRGGDTEEKTTISLME